MADYEFSTAYVEAFVRALKRSPKAQEIEARLSSDAKHLFKNPWSDPWQPAALFEQIGEIAVSELGENVFEELTRTTMRERFGPILVPMLKSTIATKSPGNLLKKLPDLTKVAVRGVAIEFHAQGPNDGFVQIVYPRPVAKYVMSSWVGVVKFVFEITTMGEVRSTTQSYDGATLQLVVNWPEPAK